MGVGVVCGVWCVGVCEGEGGGGVGWGGVVWVACVRGVRGEVEVPGSGVYLPANCWARGSYCRVWGSNSWAHLPKMPHVGSVLFFGRQMLLFAPFFFCAAKCVFAVCGCALLPRRPSEPPLVQEASCMGLTGTAKHVLYQRRTTWSNCARASRGVRVTPAG